MCAELQQRCYGLHLPGAHPGCVCNLPEESQGPYPAQQAADGGVEGLDAGDLLPACMPVWSRSAQVLPPLACRWPGWEPHHIAILLQASILKNCQLTSC